VTALTFLRDEKDCPIHIGRKEEDLTIHIVLLNLALHRLEVTLNPAHANRERINQVKALCVFGEHRREIARDNVSSSGS